MRDAMGVHEGYSVQQLASEGTKQGIGHRFGEMTIVENIQIHIAQLHQESNAGASGEEAVLQLF